MYWDCRIGVKKNRLKFCYVVKQTFWPVLGDALRITVSGTTSALWYLWHFSICVSSLQKCFWEVGDNFLYWNLLGNKLLKRFISVWISTWKFEENLFVLIHWSAWLRRRRLTTKSSTIKCQNQSPKINQELWASANKLWVKYYHRNCSQTSQKEEAREETHMEKV